MNQVGMVGRLVRTPELRETENNKKMAWITVAVTRSFKNMDGEYETDFIDCVLWGEVAKNVAEYCKKGDIISVRGRLQSRIVEKDGEKRQVMDVVGEKITFISSIDKQKKEQER